MRETLSKKSIRDLSFAGKKVLVRVDLNVPFKKGTVEISDDWRIRAVMPTIQLLKEEGASVILITHLGRPDGKVVEDLRLNVIAQRFSELLKEQIIYLQDCIGAKVDSVVEDIKPGEVVLLENLRFHPEEESNNVEFARKLAGLADFYVNDAFSVSHRAHASVDAITHFLPAVAGLLMERELEMLGRTLEQPRRPLGAIVGGEKVSDKMIVLEQLLEKADFLLIGGGMVATFLQAQGFYVGNSHVEKDRIDFATELLENSTAKGCEILLPSDVVVAEEFKKDALSRMVTVDDIPNEYLIMDIGSQSVVSYTDALYQCKTVIWNGPVGVFEWEQFASGTKGIARALGSLEDATTLVGGGSTAEAIASLGLAEKITLVSTGGGATLEFLEGRELPGVASLQDKN